MKIFDKLARKKEKETISVEMFDEAGKVIRISEMLPEELPEKFDFSTRILLEDAKYVIHEAVPNSAEEYLRTKKLTLKMSKLEWFDTSIAMHIFPSACHKIADSNDIKFYKKDLFAVAKKDYRQTDFFYSYAIPDIKKDLKDIIKVKENHAKKIGGVLTFTDCYVRVRTREPNLQIDFDELKGTISIVDIGNLKYTGLYSGYIKNGIAFKTENTLYYGILNNDNMITSLCMGEYTDHTLIEINQILNAFDLVFVDWYNVSLIHPR